MQKTLGGDRLGSGKKMKVDLHGYERSTHNLSYLWRSTMSAGTLVPFMSEVALPGDTFDIDLDCDIKTHPTVGPLFGSYKVQLDTFVCPIRLYQGQLHNNKLGIGMNMQNVALPIMTLYTPAAFTYDNQPDNTQINPSCILSYLGIRGIGNPLSGSEVPRAFNALTYLMYWDIFKNYYANKQEENAYVIHTALREVDTSVTQVDINGNTVPNPADGTFVIATRYELVEIPYVGTVPDLDTIIFITNLGNLRASDVLIDTNDTGTQWEARWYGKPGTNLTTLVTGWDYAGQGLAPTIPPVLQEFPLADIDTMREALLVNMNAGQFDVSTYATGNTIKPYVYLFEGTTDAQYPYINTQEGLAVKTYQSDIFNNWLNEETITGVNGVNAVTAIDTSGGSFTIDTLQLSKKVYDMLNRVAVSGGTYDDWLDAIWTHDRYIRPETPVYQGGLIRELVFQEVISNSESNSNENAQPLGTLAGKGVMGHKKKGGKIVIKIDEPSYIIGIVSLTPRIDYSQGNKWDVHLQTMDDFHKPALDQIGFQDLITEQMAWWDTSWDGSTWNQKSAGKQPAWLNYMTNYNRTYGNFAEEANEMFMTLNRRYQFNFLGNTIEDLTTYIDPTKFNYSFADTALDAQNFWAQIAVDITARRKMSAKVMPNL